MKKNTVITFGLALVAGIAAQLVFSKKADQTDSRKPASLEAAAKPKGPTPEARLHHHVHHFSATGPAGYSPGQIRKAYGIDLSLGTGAGQTIAIINAFGSAHLQNDFNTFNSHFGLPAAKIQIYYPQGKPSKSDSGWALETSLDAEWAHAVAPGAKLMLVVAKSANYSDLMGAIDYALSHGATQVSMSWGTSEFPGETSLDFHFDNSKASFFASSGDNGTGMLWPAASPNVTSVGGTSLSLDATGNLLQPEVAWSGSGGGLSTYEVEPSFQSQSQASGHRAVPDVSYNADPSTGFPVYDTVGYSGQTGWFQVGGTSAGAPQWAALVAVINSRRSSPLLTLDQALYALAKSKNPDFRDILSGCNGSPSPLTCAQAGYDLVTGLGSPLAVQLTAGLRSL
jgi:subtilase family serine protease